MELDSKDSEIEQLRQRLSMLNSETASCNSGADLENADADGACDERPVPDRRER